MKKILKQVLILSAAIGLAACGSTPADYKTENRWEVDPQTGNYEENTVHSTIIYSTEGEDLPELELPKKKK